MLFFLLTSAPLLDEKPCGLDRPASHVPIFIAERRWRLNRRCVGFDGTQGGLGRVALGWWWRWSGLISRCTTGRWSTVLEKTRFGSDVASPSLAVDYGMRFVVDLERLQFRMISGRGERVTAVALAAVNRQHRTLSRADALGLDKGWCDADFELQVLVYGTPTAAHLMNREGTHRRSGMTITGRGRPCFGYEQLTQT